MRKRSLKSQPSDTIKLRGSLEFVLRNAFTGEIVRHGRKDNAVVFIGRSWVLGRIATNTTTNYIACIAFGSSSNNDNSSQTTMGGYMTYRAVGTTGHTTASNSTPSASWAVSFTNTETWSSSSAIREFALFNTTPPGSGTMFSRVVTGTDVNFGTSNTLAVTYTVSA